PRLPPLSLHDALPIFPAAAVEEARLSVRITKVEGAVVGLLLEGSTRAVHRGKWSIRGYRDMDRSSPQERGLKMRLLGHARYDLKDRKSTRLNSSHVAI